MTSLTELRELADKATPGPWTVGGRGRDICVRLGPHSGAPGRLWPERSDDTRYIARCSPEVVKALIAVAEAAEGFWEDSDLLLEHHEARVIGNIAKSLDALKEVLK